MANSEREAFCDRKRRAEERATIADRAASMDQSLMAPRPCLVFFVPFLQFSRILLVKFEHKDTSLRLLYNQRRALDAAQIRVRTATAMLCYTYPPCECVHVPEKSGVMAT